MDEIGKLGFGFMRLPVVEGDGGKEIDIEQVKHMVDLFMDAGFTYFDTARGYHNGRSEAALREASRNRRGSRAVGIRIGGLGQRREQSPCPGKPRPRSANHGTVAAGYEALVAGDAEFRGHVPEPDMDAAPGVIREKYRQRVLAVREQLEALAAPPRYRGFGVAFQYFSERADLGFIECVARSHARGTRRQKKSGLVEIAEQPNFVPNQ